MQTRSGGGLCGRFRAQRGDHDYISKTVGAVETEPLDEFDRYRYYLAKLR
ncbi:MAG: hypothetical protein V8Q27_05775 [Eubacteriales bacterium]